MTTKLIVFIDLKKFGGLFNNQEIDFLKKYSSENEEGKELFFNRGNSKIIFINKEGNYYFQEYSEDLEKQSMIIIIPDNTVIQNFICTSDFNILRHTNKPAMLDYLEKVETFKGLFSEKEATTNNYRPTLYKKLADLIVELDNNLERDFKIGLIKNFFDFLEQPPNFLKYCLSNNLINHHYNKLKEIISNLNTIDCIKESLMRKIDLMKDIDDYKSNKYQTILKEMGDEVKLIKLN